MFSWFRFSTVCYVYLSDVPSLAAEQLLRSNDPFYRCRWFTRGWTLEELIAPPVVHFFDSGWNFFGTKISLSQQLSHITGIPRSCPTGSTVVGDYSIAERMSWASRRLTTRVEDQAYCLMGLFDVNIPLQSSQSSSNISPRPNNNTNNYIIRHLNKSNQKPPHKRFSIKHLSPLNNKKRTNRIVIARNKMLNLIAR